MKYLFLVLGLLVACGRNTTPPRFGAAIDKTAPEVSLAQLVAQPAAYEGKTVTVNGTYAGACGDGDFYFKDKFNVIEADPPEASDMMGRIQKGTPIRLHGVVKVHRSTTREPTIHLVAKAVEVLPTTKS